VGWNEDDARRVQAVASLLDPFLPDLIEDFYAEIERHPGAFKVITGGQPQIDRLKASLIRWLRELLAGPYDQGYVVRRWQVGRRHVEIGLDQIYTNVALSRLRAGLMGALGQSWLGNQIDLVATRAPEQISNSNGVMRRKLSRLTRTISTSERRLRSRSKWRAV